LTILVEDGLSVTRAKQRFVQRRHHLEVRFEGMEEEVQLARVRDTGRGDAQR
jgi:hypothetical protein